MWIHKHQTINLNPNPNPNHPPGEDYTIRAASYCDISIFFRLNFVTVVDLCIKKFS